MRHLALVAFAITLGAACEEVAADIDTSNVVATSNTPESESIDSYVALATDYCADFHMEEAEYLEVVPPVQCLVTDECLDGFDVDACLDAAPDDMQQCTYDPVAACDCALTIADSQCGPEDRLFVPAFPSDCFAVYTCLPVE